MRASSLKVLSALVIGFEDLSLDESENQPTFTSKWQQHPANNQNFDYILVAKRWLSWQYCFFQEQDYFLGELDVDKKLMEKRSHKALVYSFPLGFFFTF